MAAPFLLDVNVLIALFDEAHVHHGKAHEWFAQFASEGWRTCPITENGLLRILSHPGYPNAQVSVLDLSERLQEFKTSAKGHELWADDFSMSEWLVARKMSVGSAQSTDAYLLKLCHRKKGRLATFDRRIKQALIGETSPALFEYLPT